MDLFEEGAALMFGDLRVGGTFGDGAIEFEILEEKIELRHRGVSRIGGLAWAPVIGQRSGGRFGAEQSEDLLSALADALMKDRQRDEEGIVVGDLAGVI